MSISFAIELFQLTGIPLRMPHVLQVALGTAFAWHDLGCYVLGALAVTVRHTMTVQRASESSRSPEGVVKARVLPSTLDTAATSSTRAGDRDGTAGGAGSRDGCPP